MKKIIFISLFIFALQEGRAQTGNSPQKNTSGQTVLTADSTKPKPIYSTSIKELYNAQKNQQGILLKDTTGTQNTGNTSTTTTQTQPSTKKEETTTTPK